MIRKYKLTSFVLLSILLLSLCPVPDVEPLKQVPLIDKWVHFIMYGALSLAMWMDLMMIWRHSHRATSGADDAFRMKKYKKVFSFATFYMPCLVGGLIEIIQPFVCRSGEWLDFLADVIGAALGTIIGLTLSRLCKVGA